MENINQEKYPQPSKNAIKNRLLWVCENRRQEKYPQPSKKAKKKDCCGYGEHKTGKIPTIKQKRQKK